LLRVYECVQLRFSPHPHWEKNSVGICVFHHHAQWGKMLDMCECVQLRFSPHPHWEKELCGYMRVSPSCPVGKRCCVCVSVYNCASALTFTGKKVLYMCLSLSPHALCVIRFCAHVFIIQPSCSVKKDPVPVCVLAKGEKADYWISGSYGSAGSRIRIFP
jgi:hypothetical protein